MSVATSFVSIDDTNADELAADREVTDPAEILERAELSLGFNVFGMSVEIDLVIRLQTNLDPE